MDLAALLALAARLGELTDAELAQLQADLIAAAEDRADDTSDETLGELDEIATALDAARAEDEQRQTEAADRQERAAATLARIRGQQDDGEGEAETPPADDEGEGDAETPPAVEDEETPAEPPQAVAASGTPPAARPRVGRVNARRPQAVAPRPTASPMGDVAAWNLVASANLSGFTAGERLNDAEKVAAAFMSAIESTKGYRHGPRLKVPVARVGNENPERMGWAADRILGDNPRVNADRIARSQELATLQAGAAQAGLTASGGICFPQQVRYDLPIVGDDARPVRDDMLNRFGADRGGVRTLPPPLLTDLDGAVDIWTHDNDEEPGSDGPATKPCLTVTCPDEDETLVDAITRCLQFGNYRARYAAEQIDAWVKLAAVAHARLAETTHLTAIGAGSTQVNVGQVLGTTRDVLATLDRAIAAMRSRHRISTAFPIRFGVPFWLRDMIRTDLARELPGSTDERLAMADAQIDAFFASRKVNVTWFLDGETGQIFGAQGDGPLIGWPSVVVGYLYPEGSWLHLDGGTLDLGIVRDSTLNSTNDVQMFAETFEGVHFHGVESLRLAMDVCPDGSVSGTVDIDPCSTGS